MLAPPVQPFDSQRGTVLVGTSRRVLLVRGEALNTFETAAFGQVRSFDVTAVGRRDRRSSGPFAVDAIFLPSLSMFRGTRRLSRWIQSERSAWDIDNLIGLDRLIKEASIVHAAETAIPWSEQAARSSERRGIPLVLTCWETIPFLHEQDARLARRKNYLRSVASHFAATTGRARNALLEEGVDPQRISVVPPSVDVARYAAAVAGAPRERRSVLVPARLIAEKGGTEAVRAWSRIPERLRSDHVLEFVGGGTAGPRIEAAADALGVADSVRITSHVPHEQMPARYQDAAFMLLPSLPTPYWEEQFGMVIAEAMASSLAVVATSSGAIPEVVGDAGIAVPPYDIDALAGAMASLLGSEAARTELGARGHARATALFDAPVVARQLEQMYEAVLR